MDCAEIILTGHALARMFDRAASPEDVRAVIDDGGVVEDYPDDAPYPSRLPVGTVAGRVLHVVVARDPATRKCYVVTVYPPDPARWEPDFRRRRQ